MRLIRRLLVPVVGAAAALALVPATAGAVACGQALVDGSGITWNTGNGGEVVSAGGGLPAGGVGGIFYSTPDPNGCTLEDLAREVAYPPYSPGPIGFQLRRKLYVPSTGIAFARALTFVTNTLAIPQTLATNYPVGLPGGYVRGSSSGDVLATPDDAWAAFAASPAPLEPPSGPPTFALVWDAAPPLTPTDRAVGLTQSPSDPSPPYTSPGPLVLRYRGITIPPGGTIAFMQLALTRSEGSPGLATALADAAALGAAPPSVYAGMSADELGQLINWPHPDPDADGVRLNADNCRTSANADQADLDKDGIGDACDPDVDGDGLGDTVEAGLGSNPRSADGDGDGRADGADACPTTAGTLPNGCPTPGADTTPGALTAPALSAPSKLARAAFLKGVKVKAGCGEPCAVQVELRASPKSVARLSAGLPTYRIVLGSASSGRAAGVRTITVKPAAALLGRARKLTVQVRATLTDAGGNQTVRTRTIKIG